MTGPERTEPNRPLYARRWLLLRIRVENRVARRAKRLSDLLRADTERLTRNAVVAYRKSEGTWPEPDHVYPEMRG